MRIDYRKGSVDRKMARVASSMRRWRGSFEDGGSWYGLIGTHAAKVRDWASPHDSSVPSYSSE